MAENSGIEWTDHTWSPWVGCTKVSPACDNCYAEGWAKRYGRDVWGAKADRQKTKTRPNVFRWNRQAEGAERRPRVFVASLADVFDNHRSILPEWRAEMWATIKACPNLDFLLLTKRPQNIERFLPDDWGDGYANVWLGTTVENQAEAHRRVPTLLQVPATRRFLSCEPLLGPVDLTCLDVNGEGSINALRQMTYREMWEESFSPAATGCSLDEALDGFEDWCYLRPGTGVPDGVAWPALDWVITGGESGPNFRPADPEWFRSLRDQCAAANVAFLFKQWEGKSPAAIKAMGRELDGVVHDGYPAARRTN